MQCDIYRVVDLLQLMTLEGERSGWKNPDPTGPWGLSIRRPLFMAVCVHRPAPSGPGRMRRPGAHMIALSIRRVQRVRRRSSLKRRSPTRRKVANEKNVQPLAQSPDRERAQSQQREPGAQSRHGADPEAARSRHGAGKQRGDLSTKETASNEWRTRLGTTRALSGRA